jgi:hypothetical protein
MVSTGFIFAHPGPKYVDTVRDAKSVFGSWAPMLLLFKKWKIIYIFVLKNLKIKSGHSK